MIKHLLTHKIITLVIALVWFINGLYCKILNQVPRHEQIVAKILNTDYSRALTILIGALEICLALWFLSGYKQKLNTTLQITIILMMNIIEFVLVPEILLWGKLNLIFALLFITLIYFHRLYFNKNDN